MAGDPDLQTTESLVLACEAGGADIIELGIPFSDPIADGPEIQDAGSRALRSGTRPRDVIDLVAHLRRRTDMSIVLMTYMNPVLGMGLVTFAEQSASAGVDGIIIPDLSFEVSGGPRTAFGLQGVDLIQLVAPSAPPSQAAEIARASRGFLYVITRSGTTGVRPSLPLDLGTRIRALRGVCPLPLAVGFGVSTKEQVRAAAAAGADGIVVGSAIVRHVAAHRSPLEVQKFVAELAEGLPVTASAFPALRDSSR